MRTHMDAFSGIGGFALAARHAGMQTLQFVEIEPFCQAVLKKNFPGVPIHGDAKTFDARPFCGRVDLLTGGFPCQPHSVAGQKKGRDDDRNLWPDLIRIVRDCRPLVCLFENVPNLANTMLDECLRDLAGAGYKSEVYVVAAEDIGASHRRDRLWIVAYSDSQRRNDGCDHGSERHVSHHIDRDATKSEPERERRISRTFTTDELLADADEAGRSQPGREFSGATELCSSQCGRATMADATATGSQTQRGDRLRTLQRTGQGFNSCGSLPLFPPARNDYGGWATTASVDASLLPCVEREVRHVANELPAGLVRRRRSARNATLKALGNAIVPQIAYLFISAILETMR